jgi:hypothetical protein
MTIQSPFLRALFAQLLGFGITATLVYIGFQSFHIRVSPFQAVWVLGFVSASIAKLLKQPVWWLPIHLLFAPALLMFYSSDVPRWIYLAVSLLILLLNWNSFKDRVPLYLTGSGMNQKLSDFLGTQKQPFSFIDLGSGLAGSLCFLARRYPNSYFFGVETAPLVFIASWIRCLPYKNCKIRYKSIWNTSLAPYDFVYCFLSPVPMPKLWIKAKTEMKPGKTFLSNTFRIPGVEPDRTLELKDWRDSKLMFWNIKNK